MQCFSGARSADPFGFLGSQADSSVGEPMRDTYLFSSTWRPVPDFESFSCFEKSLSKGQRSRVLESVQLSEVEKERMNRQVFMDP